MCEFCKKHAGGKDKWYFNPKNYSKEMGEARIELLEKVAGVYFEEMLVSDAEVLGRFKKIPILNKLLKNLGRKHFIEIHGGQLIPLKDALNVLDLCGNPAVLPCECRRVAGMEKYCCLNFGLIPELYKKANPDDYIEEISINKAKMLLKDWDAKGLSHLIIWYKAPYVASICNCSNSYCFAYKAAQVHGLENILLRGEYVAKVNQKLCCGCKNCLTRCPFDAISFNVDAEKAFVDIKKCFGCGLCETGCQKEAITLIDRKLTPAKNLW
jgi:ferredoxin